jgi:hypothetical protein
MSNFYQKVFYSTLAGAFMAALPLSAAEAWIAGEVVLAPAPAPLYYPAAPAYAYPAPYPYPPVPGGYPAFGALPPPAPVPGGYPTANSAPAENCQQYSHSVVIAGEKQTVFGHACRQVDGTWRIID